MGITSLVVYTKPGCTQCDFTTKLMDKLGIEYELVDVTVDHGARARLRDIGITTLPCVIAHVGGQKRMWTGFSPDKIKALLS